MIRSTLSSKLIQKSCLKFSSWKNAYNYNLNQVIQRKHGRISYSQCNNTTVRKQNMGKKACGIPKSLYHPQKVIQSQPPKRKMSSNQPSPKKTNIETTTTTKNNNENYKQTLSAFTIGTLAGTCGSLAGMGGGFIMIPLMTSTHKLLSMNLTQHVAHGTSLFAVAATGIAGATSYATSTKEAVDVESAVCITVCAMMTARLGALYSTKLSQVSLKKVLGVFMICVSPIIPLKPYLNGWNSGSGNAGRSASDGETNALFSTKVKDSIISGGIGLGSGFMAGLLGVGGGAVVVPALTLFTSMDHYMALGTSLAAMILPAVVGTITHYKKGNVNLRVAPALAVGSLVGAYAGGRVGVKMDEDKLRYGFSSVMFGLGLKTLIRG